MEDLKKRKIVNTIQWNFPVRESLFDRELSLKRKVYSFLRLINAESLTKIKFKDCNGETLTMHTLLNPKIFGEHATEWLIRYIKNTLKKDSRVYYVELIRD